MAGSVNEITNWMHLFRWIVKLIRDEYGVDEKLLTRHAMLEGDLSLTNVQLEEVLDHIKESFGIQFPDDTLDQVLRLEELCLVTSWIKGMYKRPEFITDHFETECRQCNPGIPL
jgi:acyl carrier protein